MRLMYRTADGRICCDTDDPNHLCPKCQEAYIAQGGSVSHTDRTTAARAAAATLPDPYAGGLRKRRDARGLAAEPVRDDFRNGGFWRVAGTSPQPRTCDEPPDPYAAALAERRQQNERGVR